MRNRINRITIQSRVARGGVIAKAGARVTLERLVGYLCPVGFLGKSVLVVRAHLFWEGRCDGLAVTGEREVFRRWVEILQRTQSHTSVI